MSITLWTPLQPQSGYTGVDALIVSLMGRKEIDLLASEKSDYRRPAILAAFQRFIQEDQACREAGFEEGVVAAFRGAGYSLWRVPVVVADPTMVLVAQNLSGHSIVRYKTVKNMGYAFHVQGYIDNPHDQTRFADRVRQLSGVVEVSTENSVEWTTWGKDSLLSDIEDVYRERQKLHPTEELRFRSEANDRHQFVTRILTGTDPVLRLVSEVPQVEQPLPEKPLK